MKKIHSLSFRIPAIISLISVALIVIILLIAVNFANMGISESRFEGFDNTVQAYAKLFDSIMISQISLAETYSVMPAVINAIINKSEQNLSDLLNALKHINTVNDYSINTVITDLDSNVIMDAAGSTTGSMAERRPTLWNKLQSNDGKFTYDDDLVKSKDTGVHSIAIGGGIKDNEGNLIGYTFVIIDWKLIHDTYFTDISLGESGRILAIDSRLIDMMDTLYDQIGGSAVQVYQKAFDSSSVNGKLSYTYSNENRTGSYYKMKTMNWVIAMSMFDSEIYEVNKQLILISSIVALAAIILLTIFVYLFIKRLMGHLGSIIKEAKEIEAGNLTYAANEHKRKDELGILFESFGNMRKKLTEIISQVNASSEKITHAAQELANGNADLSKRTESQAASLEETASSMEEMASTIKSSTSHSVEGNNMMKESMDSIQNAGVIIEETTKSIEEVSEDSEKIKNITKVIEGIAFQTNILALNAAVEAARAGEQGKGFAVVASEVRNLAQNSQTSAKDITNLIEVIYEKISKSAEKNKRISADI